MMDGVPTALAPGVAVDPNTEPGDAGDTGISWGAGTIVGLLGFKIGGGGPAGAPIAPICASAIVPLPTKKQTAIAAGRARFAGIIIGSLFSAADIWKSPPGDGGFRRKFRKLYFVGRRTHLGHRLATDFVYAAFRER